MRKHLRSESSRRMLTWTAALLAAVSLPALVRADSAAPGADAARGPQGQLQAIEPSQYMRFSDDGHGGGKLETAVVSFRNEAGQVVKLVGAIHIGEKGYYEQLNDDFTHEDAVLYELVKPHDAAPPKHQAAPAPAPGGLDNPVSSIQHLMKDVLNLSFQLDVIDYTRPNFVHADLDKETFEKLQEERGETFEALLMKQLMKAFTHPNDADDKTPANPPPAGAAAQDDTDKMVHDALRLLTQPDMERQIKVVVARQLTDMQSTGKNLEAFGGPQSVLIGERNKAALKVLAGELAQHRQHISIFYGAAHMPDMGAHLREMGFKCIACEWKPAWDLTLRPDQPSAVENIFKQLMKALDDQ